MSSVAEYFMNLINECNDMPLCGLLFLIVLRLAELYTLYCNKLDQCWNINLFMAAVDTP